MQFEWRGEFTNAELNALHAEAFSHAALDLDWRQQVHAHSLGWVTSRDAETLVGFANVTWDGRTRAFLLDVMVATPRRRRGIGTQLVALATIEARKAGCKWLHVDFDDARQRFYFDACHFNRTCAGLIVL